MNRLARKSRSQRLPENQPKSRQWLPQILGLTLLLLSLFQPKFLALLTLLWFLSQLPIAKNHADGSSS